MKNIKVDVKVLKIQFEEWLFSELNPAHMAMKSFLELPEMKLFSEFVRKDEIYQIIYAEYKCECDKVDTVEMQVLLTDLEIVFDYIWIIDNPNQYQWKCKLLYDFPAKVYDIIEEYCFGDRKPYTISFDEYEEFSNFLESQKALS